MGTHHGAKGDHGKWQQDSGPHACPSRLHAAAAAGNLQALQSFMKSFSYLDIGDDRDGTLHMAASGGHLEVVQWLLDHGAKDYWSYHQGTGVTALHLAATKGHTAVVEALCAANRGMINADDEASQRTALHLAAAGGHVATAAALIAAGAESSYTDKYCHLPVTIAAARGDAEMVKVLAASLSAAAATRHYLSLALHAAVMNGCLPVVQTLMAAHAQPDLRCPMCLDASSSSSNNFSSPVHSAAAKGDADILQCLLAPVDTHSDIDVNARDLNRRTSLHIASFHGHADIITSLVAYGAEPEIEDPRNRSALHFAAMKGHLAAVNALIQSNAALDTGDWDRLTPLHHAAANGHTAVVLSLTAAGCARSPRASHGQTPLHKAVIGGHADAVAALIAAGAPVHEPILHYLQPLPLHLAAQHGHLAVADLLLRSGAFIEATDLYGATALHYAMSSRHEAMAVELLVAGANAQKLTTGSQAYLPLLRPLLLRLQQEEQQLLVTSVVQQQRSLQRGVALLVTWAGAAAQFKRQLPLAYYRPTAGGTARSGRLARSAKGRDTHGLSGSSSSGGNNGAGSSRNEGGSSNSSTRNSNGAEGCSGDNEARRSSGSSSGGGAGSSSSIGSSSTSQHGQAIDVQQPQQVQQGTQEPEEGVHLVVHGPAPLQQHHQQDGVRLTRAQQAFLRQLDRLNKLGVSVRQLRTEQSGAIQVTPAIQQALVFVAEAMVARKEQEELLLQSG